MSDQNFNSEIPPDFDQRREVRNGVLFAVGGYVIWGFVPLFWKYLDHVPAFEVLLHRIVWSLPFLALWLLFRGRLLSAIAAIKNLKTCAMMMASALLVSVNWGVFIWAVNNDRILEASFGYYINPLANVLIGCVLLSEQLSKGQVLAIGLAFIAILIQIWSLGSLPWVSLTLAISFSFYGFCKKKTANIGAAQGLFIEVLLLAPCALAGIYYLHLQGQNNFSFDDQNSAALLIIAGVVTSVPLVLFAAGARRIRLITIGILQYIVPTMHFLIAVFIYNKITQPLQLLSFGLIWFGLAIFTYDAYKTERSRLAHPPSHLV